MKYHYVWIAWSGGFLLPWLALYVTKPRFRPVMWRVSLVTAMFGLTEPIWVPEYWNPPSLLELARRTGFDIESFIFSFAIGGIGAVLYDALTNRHFVPVSALERRGPWHRFHAVALWSPYVLFVALYFLPWNPIYPAILCMVVGGIGSGICRPELKAKGLVGGAVFFVLYAMFMLGLVWFTPGYIPQVWNLPALSGILIVGIPLEELLFGFSFGWYWTGVYEHFTWSTSVTHARTRSVLPPPSAARKGGAVSQKRSMIDNGMKRTEPLTWRALLALLSAMFAVAVGYPIVLRVLAFFVGRVTGTGDPSALSRNTGLLTMVCPGES